MQLKLRCNRSINKPFGFEKAAGRFGSRITVSRRHQIQFLAAIPEAAKQEAFDLCYLAIFYILNPYKALYQFENENTKIYNV